MEESKTAREIVLIASNGVGFSTQYLVKKLEDLKVLVVDPQHEPITVHVANKHFTDTVKNVETGLATDLVKYIEKNLTFKNKTFKYGGMCEPILIDDPYRFSEDGHKLKGRRKGRFGGSNFTPPKKKRRK